MRSSDPYLLEPYPTNIVHLMQERLMVFRVNPKRITAKNIEAAVDNLASPKDAEIFYMRYKEHIKLSEIAERTGTTSSSVGAATSRVFIKIYRYLTACLDVIEATDGKEHSIYYLGFDDRKNDMLLKAGYDTIESLYDETPDTISNIKYLGGSRSMEIYNAIQGWKAKHPETVN